MRLSASDLTCVRGGREVFAQLAFSVSGGEVLLVTGRNGAGKSSLLRMIAGLVRTAQGRLELTGGDPELTIGEQSHYLGHQDGLKPSLSVVENLQFWAGYLGAREVALGDVLAVVGLAALADLPAAYLSAGQRRRLAIARLIAVERPIWLLDEPTSALDSAAQARLVDLMRKHLSGGGLILAATHGPVGLDGVPELRLDQTTPSQDESARSPLAQPAPSPLVGEGWGGGSNSAPPTSPQPQSRTTPTPNPSPQAGGEQERRS